MRSTLLAASFLSSFLALDLLAAPYCPNEYADDFSVLLPKARELEQKHPSYTFCIRTTATYECPSYGADGNLQRSKKKVVAHGTGFAYRNLNGEAYVLTNQHVAEWPAVTDAEHTAEDIPPGCRRVANSVKIVDDESDNYDRDDIQLSSVVSDVSMDVSILKAKAPLPVLPWKIGHSSGMKERNVVDIRGFPLGVFKATNAGKVVAAYDHDDYNDWDHVDFVVDALLSHGNSGSPVFAISCKTGEFELVGIYHAGYSAGSALNVVIGIDQVRDMMTTLKKSPRPKQNTGTLLDQLARKRVISNAPKSMETFFPFGAHTASVQAREDGVLFFKIMNRSFPLRSYPTLIIEDLPTIDPKVFGDYQRVWIGNRQGLKLHRKSDLDSDAQELFGKLLDGMRDASLESFELSAADVEAEQSREKFDRSKRLEKSLQKTASSYSELVQNMVDFAEKRGPQPGEKAFDVLAILKDTEKLPVVKQEDPAVAARSEGEPAPL